MEIRQLTSDDTAAVLRLSASANWNQTAADVVRLLDLDSKGCFAAVVDGQVVGTATATSYGVDLGWVGMVLVDPPYRRRGIATALVEATLDYLRGRGIATIKLDATPAGQPVYERLGFRAESTLERWQAIPPPPTAALATGEWADVAALDRAAFGADRGELLRQISTDSALPFHIVHDPDGKLIGYALARPGRLAGYVGPVVAIDAETAAPLISAVAAALGSGLVFIDIDPALPGAVQLAARLGFVRQRDLVRMRLGPPLRVERSVRVVAIGGPEVG